MFNLLYNYLSEDMKKSLRVWHILAFFFSIFFVSVIGTLIIMFATPKYFTYLEKEDMRRTVLWTETHAKLARMYGPDFQKFPEYSKIMLYNKASEDLEEINVR